MRLPTPGEAVQQRQQQLFTERDGRVQRHGLIELLVEGALGQVAHRFDQRLLAQLPVPLWGNAWGVFKQLTDLADRSTTLEPAQDRLHLLDLVGAVQTMPLGRALRLEQTIAPLPGAQGDRVYPSAASKLADGHQIFRLHCVNLGFRGGAADRPAG